MNKKLLPQKTINFSFTSDLDGESYNGIFVFRRKTIADESKIRVRNVQLNGGLHYDPDSPGVGIDVQTNYLNFMISTIEVLAVQVPEWFDTNALFDADLVGKLYKEVKDFQNSFRKQRVPVNDGSSQSRSEAPTAVADEFGSAANMVFSQVPSSLEPR